MPDNDRPKNALEENAREAERLTAALREAGEVALRTFRTSIRSWTKAHNSPVSEADMAVDALLRERLARPGLGWLSEESDDDRSRLAESRVYIADPIDGTRAYLAGQDDWSICAALVEHGRPVIGAVYAPVHDEMFLALAGGGATHNGRRLHVQDAPDIANGLVAGPKSYLERLTDMGTGIRHCPKIHSLALRFARVAEGRVDAAFASGNSADWDLAAADLLVHEAGGSLTNMVGERPVYNLREPRHGALIAAGPARHQAMIALMRDKWKQFA